MTATSAIDAILRSRTVLLTTLRRDGTPVSTPVWLVPRGDAIWVMTLSTSGKVKRIRQNPRVMVAPCTQAGKVTGPTVEGRARLMTPAESDAVITAIVQRYGVVARLIGLVRRVRRTAPEVGIAITFADR